MSLLGIIDINIENKSRYTRYILRVAKDLLISDGIVDDPLESWDVCCYDIETAFDQYVKGIQDIHLSTERYETI